MRRSLLTLSIRGGVNMFAVIQFVLCLAVFVATLFAIILAVKIFNDLKPHGVLGCLLFATGVIALSLIAVEFVFLAITPVNCD